MCGVHFMGNYVVAQTWKSDQTLPPSFVAYWFTNWPSCMEGKARPKKEAGHSGWVGDKSNKQGTLRRLVLNSHKTSGYLWPPTSIFTFYVETLTEFSHVYCPDGLNNTSLCLSGLLS